MAGKFERYPYQAEMIVKLRKKHPCGGSTWRLIRIGADARLECTTCRHQMTLTRRALEKATAEILSE